MTIAWTEDLSVGVEELDAHHRELYRRVDALLAAMRAGRRDEVPALLAFLGRYTQDHFRTEERQMAERGYPARAEHVARHEEFARTMAAHQARLHDHGATTSLAVELGDWLTGWLRDHLRGADLELGRFLRGS